MKILIISYNRIGDTILATGLINYLLQKYKKATFSIITSPISKIIYQDMPRLDNLIVIEKQKYSMHWFQIWQECRGISWGIIVDLRSTALSYFLKSKKKYILNGNKNDHILAQLKSLIRSQENLKPHIWALEKNYLDIKKNKNLYNKYICIAPISNSIIKDWSINNYINLINSEIFNDYQIILLGAISKDSPESGKNDQNNINKLISNSSGNINNLIGNADMIETYFILKESSLFIGSDSSNMHLSNAANIPTIGLFGPTNERLYGPIGKNTLSLRGTKTYLEVINQKDYKANVNKSFLDDLDVSKVYNEVKNIIN